MLITQPGAKNQRDTPVRVFRARKKGWEYALNTSEETGELLASKHGPRGLDAKTEVATHKALATLTRSPNGPLWIHRGNMEDTIEAAVGAGSISEVLPVDEVLGTTIRERRPRAKGVRAAARGMRPKP